MIPPSLRAAVRHLTVVPVPYDPAEAGAARARVLAWFPLVGLGIGCAVWATLRLPLPPLAGAAVALAVWTFVTGALHEDGFLDCADAALATVPRARRLEILDDPHVGAHAVTAGGVLLLARFAGLASAPAAAALAAPVIGRWCMALTLALLRPAKPRGLGADFAQGARVGPPAAVAAVVLVTLGAFGDALRVGGSAAAGLAAGLAAAAFLAGRFGGVSGDVHGAAGLVAETAALLAYGAWP